MRHDQARCTSCNTIVTLPSLKTRTAQCHECMRAKATALNAARPATVEPWKLQTPWTMIASCDWGRARTAYYVVKEDGSVELIGDKPEPERVKPVMLWEKAVISRG